MLTRRGFTLVELLVALALALVVLGTATGSLLRQQRSSRRLAALGDDDVQLRAATALLPGELLTLNPSTGDLVAGEASDTAIQLRTPVAISLACARDVGAATLLPSVAGEVLLGGLASLPRAGDSLWWLADRAWLGRRITAAYTVSANCYAPVAASGLSIRVVLASRDTIEAGAPLRVTRPVRYAYYTASGSWSLGYREWNDATSRFSPPQPVVGSLLRRDGGRRSGFRYFDTTGTELVPSNAPIDVRKVARVRTTALTRVGDRERGQDSVRADSLDVALRHVADP
jgi:prepilin-type N-terminal cleavage/methylation domain-containing protein